ncbi:codeine O-demethylase-like [Papaver somniferum]|uniref:codeine O-demethylase-like n=1 Tax=Papaver somniferum TaxID=3469 RepID=UPI000E6FC8CE|nr:codeine O-demethylase-like [Papaver somniferum]
METPKLKKLGGSLFVPSTVQELARQSLAEVPTRYIRYDQDTLSNNISGTSSTDQSVPVIDLQKLMSPEPNIYELELDKLHSACKVWGFFQVVNHGVDFLLMEKVKSKIEGLFNLPMDEKMKFWQEQGDSQGFGQNFTFQSKVQNLDWGDKFSIITLPQHTRNPRLLPKLPLPLRDTIESYSFDLSKLSMTLLEFMEKALQIETRVIAELFEDGRQAMRMNYYPPCPQPEQVIGFTPHSDACGLTILLQLNQVDGLQIRKEKMWIPIKPLSNAFVVNIGDILEIMSNGVYRSVEHRATVNSTKERLSVATFHSPKVDTEIGPILSMVTPETPALFRTIGYEDYMKKFFTRTVFGKALVDAMRIEEGYVDNNTLA